MATDSVAKADQNIEKNRLKMSLLVSVLLSVAQVGYLSQPLLQKWGGQWFFWHPFCMIIGAVLLPAASAVAKRLGGYFWTKFHGISMGVAFSISLFAFYVIYSNKELIQKAHFTSWHSWGGAMWLMAAGGMTAGGLGALDPDYKRFLGLNKEIEIQIRWYHKYSGRALLLLSCLVCASGWAQVFSWTSPSMLPLLMPWGPLVYFAFF